MSLNTAYVERTNLTSRQMNERMVRKAYSRIPINLKLMVPIKNFVHNSDTYDLIRS